MGVMREKLNHFFRDKNGKVVVWQSPNPLLYAWIVFAIIAMLLRSGSRAQSGFEHLRTIVLFAWAYSEITEGVNYFRRMLGTVVLATIVYGLFT